MTIRRERGRLESASRAHFENARFRRNPVADHVQFGGAMDIDRAARRWSLDDHQRHRPYRIRASRVNGARTMRIAFYGNYCNFYYELAKALRADSEFDIHLYIDSVADVQQRPESDDPALAAAYPDWIHVGRYNNLVSRVAPWRSPLVRAIAS